MKYDRNDIDTYILACRESKNMCKTRKIEMTRESRIEEMDVIIDILTEHKKLLDELEKKPKTVTKIRYKEKKC